MRNRGTQRVSVLWYQLWGLPQATQLALQSPRVGEGASATVSASGYALLPAVSGETASGGQGALPLCTPHQDAPGPGSCARSRSLAD